MRAMRPNQSQTNLTSSAIHLLHRAGQCAGDVFHEEMSDGGLTPRQYAVLLTAARDEGLSQTRLVEKTGIDRSTLADIIQRMLRKGLLQRRRTKQDARTYAVRLTDKGHKALDAATPAASHADERILAALTPSERNQFIAALETIVKAMDGAMDGLDVASANNGVGGG